ncbi:MAG: FAD-binding protein [Peptococcaceae bacterium]
MNEQNRKDIWFETDVLVIGGGASGLWAANRVKSIDENLDVLIVDKGPKGWGGLMAMSGGDFDAVLPDENVDDWVKDLIYYWDGLCDQELVEELFKISYDRLQDYQELGNEYFTDAEGKLRGVPQRGLDHFKLYPTKLKGKGGEDMAKSLFRETERLGSDYLGRTLITDLLKNEDKVVGAVGFNTRTGDFNIFKAKAVVLTAGAGGWKANYLQNTSTGEGFEMAFRAGAEMKNCEFVKVWNVPKLFSWEGQTTLLPLGARFVNAEGESFMEKYSPILGGNTDPHYTTMAMAFETKAGKGPLYFDVSKIKKEDLELIKPQTGWQLMNHEKLVDEGVDFFSGKTEWLPQMYEMVGGLVSDVKGRTTVPGLFAAGRCRVVDTGVYIGGFALSTCATSGYLAGEAVVEYIKSEDLSNAKINAAEVNELKKKLFAPLGKPGLIPKDVLRAVQNIVFPYDVCVLKNEKSLLKALDKLEAVKEDYLPRMRAADPHYLMNLREVRGVIFNTELYLKASLMRKESRAGHFREDYPERDDNWLKWIVISGGEVGETSFRTEPVPIEKYKHPITRYYSDNFRF